MLEVQNLFRPREVTVDEGLQAVARVRAAIHRSAAFMPTWPPCHERICRPNSSRSYSQPRQVTRPVARLGQRLLVRRSRLRVVEHAHVDHTSLAPCVPSGPLHQDACRVQTHVERSFGPTHRCSTPTSPGAEHRPRPQPFAQPRPRRLRRPLHRRFAQTQGPPACAASSPPPCRNSPGRPPTPSPPRPPGVSRKGDRRSVASQGSCPGRRRRSGNRPATSRTPPTRLTKSLERYSTKRAASPQCGQLRFPSVPSFSAG